MFQLLKHSSDFPPVSHANKDGLLAFGGDLSPKRLITAYQQGIFPWYNAEDEILWWAPDPRMVLFPDEVKISKSMRSLIRKQKYRITINKAFEEVVKQCALVTRNGQEGTWLHPEMQRAYINLYKIDRAFSLEVWNNEDKLVGGLYVVKNNRHVWSGESMFHLEANTSKLAFIHLAQLGQKKGIDIIDCQIYTDHLASMGAKEIPREDFMQILQK